jgi:hypothetical protein
MENMSNITMRFHPHMARYTIYNNATRRGEPCETLYSGPLEVRGRVRRPSKPLFKVSELFLCCKVFKGDYHYPQNISTTLRLSEHNFDEWYE